MRAAVAGPVPDESDVQLVGADPGDLDGQWSPQVVPA
jgi:hypothetical protein